MSRVRSVVDAITETIIHGQFRPGDKLPTEAELAARIGVSRGTLREGIRALAVQGVVEARQGDGTYVTSLEPDLLLESLDVATELHSLNNPLESLQVRRILETEAACLAAQAWTPELDERALAIIAESEQVLLHEPEDINALIETDRQFHRTIGLGSGNSMLTALIGALNSRTSPARLQRAKTDHEASLRSVQEHRAILDAVRAGYVAAAGIRMSAHILAVEEYTREHHLETQAGEAIAAIEKEGLS